MVRGKSLAPAMVRACCAPGYPGSSTQTGSSKSSRARAETCRPNCEPGTTIICEASQRKARDAPRYSAIASRNGAYPIGSPYAIISLVEFREGGQSKEDPI